MNAQNVKKYDYPDWVLEHKSPGSELRCLRGRYYKYAISSKWDPEKKKAVKITGPMLGSITKEGFKPSKGRQQEDEVQMATNKAPSVVEYGATSLLRAIGKPIQEALKKCLPEQGEDIFACALFRLLDQLPLKNIQDAYNDSYHSIVSPSLRLGPKMLTKLMASVGRSRKEIVAFFTSFMLESTHILFDATHVTTQSKHLGINEQGYNSKGDQTEQVNLLYMFGMDQQKPAYYRVVPGNIRETSAVALSIKEFGAKNVVIVADKGFSSSQNFQSYRDAGLQYIIPLRRNSSEIKYDTLTPLEYNKFDGHFLYKNRPIWHKKVTSNDTDKVLLFYDGALAEQEKRDYLQRIENGCQGYSVEQFHKKQHKFGTLAIKTNLAGSLSAQKVYEYYKRRMNVEQMFDTFKNTLFADKTYMQSKENLEAWMFINHIALMLYYDIYARLQKADLLSRYTPADVLRYAKQVRKVKIGEKWETTEVSKKFRDLLEKLELPIP